MNRQALSNAPLRTAVIATAAVGILYLLVASGVVAGYVGLNYHRVDQQLLDQATYVRAQAQLGGQIRVGGMGTIGWVQDQQTGEVIAFGFGPNQAGVLAPSQIPSPPSLPEGQVTTATVQGASYRFLKTDIDADGFGWLIIGQSVQLLNETAISLASTEALIGPLLLALVFFAAWWIGRSASAPVERARRRELAFTADASHELRTPLQVIEAESSLALMRERPAAAYRETIERISAESGRLRSIVDDLFWLARVENEGLGHAETMTLDLADVMHTTLERFRGVASRRAIELDSVAAGGAGHAEPPLVVAPAAWIDRLAGVLVDNAIRYTPDGGRIELSAFVREGRAVLSVADSGPGIPEGQGERIFERFHRASQKPGGAGLGLAIANTVVSATQGRWLVSRSPRLGGAQFEVAWPLQRAAAVAHGRLAPASASGERRP